MLDYFRMLIVFTADDVEYRDFFSDTLPSERGGPDEAAGAWIFFLEAFGGGAGGGFCIDISFWKNCNNEDNKQLKYHNLHCCSKIQ